MRTPEMYSNEGDQAVIRAMAAVSIMAETDLTIRNRATLAAVARPILEGVAVQHPEIYDTEPRNWVEDRLDEICKTHGWVVNDWDCW